MAKTTLISPPSHLPLRPSKIDRLQLRVVAANLPEETGQELGLLWARFQDTRNAVASSTAQEFSSKLSSARYEVSRLQVETSRLQAEKVTAGVEMERVKRAVKQQVRGGGQGGGTDLRFASRSASYVWYRVYQSHMIHARPLLPISPSIAASPLPLPLPAG